MNMLDVNHLCHQLIISKAFHQHNTSPLDAPETSVFSSSTWTQADTPDKTAPDVAPVSKEEQNRHMIFQGEAGSERVRHGAMGSRAERELLSLSPSLTAATLLVNKHLNRVHWFLLVFHQSEF